MNIFTLLLGMLHVDCWCSSYMNSNPTFMFSFHCGKKVTKSTKNIWEPVIENVYYFWPFKC